MNNLGVWLQVGFLTLGILLLWWSGNRTVSFAAQTAYLFNVSTFFVGLMLTSITTGLPELIVALTALLREATPLSVGAVIGSNFSDISLVLGTSATLVGTIQAPARQRKNLLIILAITSFLMLFVFATKAMHPWHGLVLMGVYIISMNRIWGLRHIKDLVEEQKVHIREELALQQYLTTKLGTIVKLFGSFVVLIAAAQVCVQSALVLAQASGIPLWVFGSTIFAIGTSLPELTLNVVAVRRKLYALALGDAFGSILEQGALILGLLAYSSPKPLQFAPIRHIIPFMIISYAIVAYCIQFRGKISRRAGISLLLLYFSFLLYEVYLITIPK